MVVDALYVFNRIRSFYVVLEKEEGKKEQIELLLLHNERTRWPAELY